MAAQGLRRCAGVHWVAPAIILASLISGIVIAVGHHLFFQSLHGKRAPTNGYMVWGTEVSRQEMNTAIGTAFAFLVKVALVSAVSTAYIQLIWRTLVHSSKAATIGHLDVLFSGISNIISLFTLTTWWRYPLLFITVLVAWLIPVASILTPATLSIMSALPNPLPWSIRHVPNIQWASLNYVSHVGVILEGIDVASPYVYNGPSNEVLGIVRSVSSSGSILPIPISLPNASWTLEFSGPAVYCSNVSQSERARIADNVAAAMAAKRVNQYLTCQPYGFLAWWKIPPSYLSGADGLPFSKFRNGSYIFNTATFVGPNDASFQPSRATFRLLSAPFAWGWNWDLPIYPVCAEHTSDVRDSLLDSSSTTMLECELLNSTYRADFHYVNGNQTINASAEPVNREPFKSAGWIYTESGNLSCPKGSEVLTSGFDESCGFHPTILSTLSYQAIMDAFQRQIFGTLYPDHTSGNTVGTSDVLSTALINSPELQFLSTRAGSAAPLDDVVRRYKDYPGLVNTNTSGSVMSLSNMIESIFRNITISMMSSDHLRPNISSQYAPQPANVTIRNFHNIYFYSSQKLWIAYGLAIAFSTLAAIVGLIVMVTNGASYSDSFSSVFRVARSADIDVAVEALHADGRDPLPEDLSKMTLRLSIAKPKPGSNPRISWHKQAPPLQAQALLSRS